MNGRYLFDTNIVIALFAKDPSVQDRMKGATEVFVPATVLGELYYGAQKSKHIQENLERINNFAKDNVVIACTTETAKLYGEIKNQLRKKGRPIPENDIWIAAISKQYHLTLVSRDAHFNEIEEFPIEEW